MVDDIASDSKSTSTTNDSKASDKCESPLFVPGNIDTQMLDKAITDAKYQKLFQKIEEFTYEIKRDTKILNERGRIDK